MPHNDHYSATMRPALGPAQVWRPLSYLLRAVALETTAGDEGEVR